MNEFGNKYQAANIHLKAVPTEGEYGTLQD